MKKRDFYPHVSLSSNCLLPSIEPLTISTDLVGRFPNGLLPLSQWTALSVDNRYLTHLLNLFFAWDNALSHIIHRTAFLEGIKSPEASETSNVCSKFLVHSLLAVSHLYLSQEVSPSQVRELRSRGRDFADEALRTLHQERLRPSLPLAQGLVLLWAYEVNFGQEDRALALLDDFYCIFNALAMNDDTPPATTDRLESQSSLKSESTAFAIWGFFCLDSKISLAFSRTMRIRPPQLARPFTGPDPSATLTPEATENFWFPYPDARRTQPSYFRDIITYECQLAELAWEASPLFGASERNASRHDYDETITMYNKLSAWNTVTVQDFLLNQGLLPSVFFLDVTFQMIQVKLLACLSRFDASKIDLQTHTSAGASYGASIISSLFVYKTAYGVRHEYWLEQACFEGAVAVLHDLGNNLGLSKAIMSACELLLLFGNYLPSANRHLWALKDLAIQLEIVLPKACARLFSILAARERRKKLKNVKLLDVGATVNGIGFGVPSWPCDFTFSGLIENLQTLE